MPDIHLACACIDGDDIEAAGLILQFINVIISFGNTLQLLLLAPVNGIFGFTVGKIIRPRFDFDKDQLIAIHRDDIDLADLAVSKVALDNTIP